MARVRGRLASSARGATETLSDLSRPGALQTWRRAFLLTLGRRLEGRSPAIGAAARSARFLKSPADLGLCRSKYEPVAVRREQAAGRDMIRPSSPTSFGDVVVSLA